MDTLSSTREARVYNGKKTTSLTSDAGKTGQPLVKEWILQQMVLVKLGNHMQKKKVKVDPNVMPNQLKMD